MSVEQRSLPRVNPDVVWTAVTDGAVLFSASRELYYGANQVAAFVWGQLEARNITLDELCTAVAEQFSDAAPDEILIDVRELLEEFARYGLVLTDAAA